MQLTTVVRDCLFLNWALPADALPAPPPPLRLDTVGWEGGEYAFVSALLFRQRGLKLAALPGLRASYPQFNLRVNTVGGSPMPSVLFHAMLVPPWVVPAARWIARQPARAAGFRYPPGISGEEDEGWRWEVVRGGHRLAVSARPSSPSLAAGPAVGNWESTVTYFRVRPLGFTLTRGRLRAIQTTHPRVTAWPVRAELEEVGLLRRLLPLTQQQEWPPLHSAWLCPEIPFTFELLGAGAHALARRAPATG
jgi:hypothetical protein